MTLPKKPRQPVPNPKPMTPAKPWPTTPKPTTPTKTEDKNQRAMYPKIHHPSDFRILSLSLKS